MLQFKDGYQGYSKKWHPDDEEKTSSSLLFMHNYFPRESHITMT